MSYVIASVSADGVSDILSWRLRADRAFFEIVRQLLVRFEVPAFVLAAWADPGKNRAALSWVGRLGQGESVRRVARPAKVSRRAAHLFREAPDPLIRERATDIEDVVRRAVGELLGVRSHNPPLRDGVIVVGDPYDGDFSEDQLEQLGSLAAPAGLVLSQIGRYEAQADMTKRLEEVAQMKSDFVSTVSHELRSPLTSIIGSLDTVNRPELAPAEPTSQELLLSARRQAGRLPVAVVRGDQHGALACFARRQQVFCPLCPDLDLAGEPVQMGVFD